MAQSNLDLSNELTSSGATNVVTKSGTNSVHGEAYGTFRDSSIAAALPSSVPVPFQRSQFGGDMGGPIMIDKLFFFMDSEFTRQHSVAPAPIPSSDPLSPFSGVIAPRSRKQTCWSTVVGTDFTTGSYTHSIRFEYLKFQNELVDAVRGSALPLANFPLSITIGPLATGPNLLAPQTTPQSDHSIKYDGSRIWGSHIIRYGISYNHIQGGGFAKFFSITPNVFDSGGAAASTSTIRETLHC